MIKILVIEEEPGLRRRYRRDLERDGYCVVSTASCRDGLDLLDRASPDLVLFDTQAADMDGLEAVERMIEHCPRVPVLCSLASRGEQLEQVGSRADGTVPRSMNTTALRSAIRGLLAPDYV